MELNTIEKFLILAHHPTKARFKTPSIQLNYGLAGALLLELSLKKSIELQNNRIILNEKFVSADEAYPILSEITKTIGQSRREHRPRYWIQKFGRRSRKIKRAFLIGMEKKRLIRIKHARFLFIPYRKTYLNETKTRDQIIYKLWEILLYKKNKSEEDIAMMGLIAACSMYRTIAPDRSKRKLIKKEMNAVLKDSPISEILKVTIRQIRVAISFAIAATAAGSHAGR